MLSRHCCFFLPRSEHFHSRTTQYIALNSYSMHSHTCRMGIGVRMLAPSAACLRNTDHCGIPGSLSTILEDTPCTQLGGESLLLILSLSLAHRHPCKCWAALAEHPSKLPTHLCSMAAVSSWRAALCLTETRGGGKAVLRWVCHHHPKTGEGTAQTVKSRVLCSRAYRMWVLRKSPGMPMAQANSTTRGKRAFFFPLQPVFPCFQTQYHVWMCISDFAGALSAGPTITSTWHSSWSM